MPDAPSETPPVVLVFAANDPSGGAGLQADLLTLASMGCHPAPVLTALTVQDTRGVEDILPIDAEWVPLIEASSFDPLMVTVTVLVAEPSALVTVKVSVTDSPACRYCTESLSSV